LASLRSLHPELPPNGHSTGAPPGPAAPAPPQKLFVVHGFASPNCPRQNVATRAGVATALQTDGLGPVSVKTHFYRQVTAHAAPFRIGFKVFLRRVYEPVLPTPA